MISFLATLWSHISKVAQLAKCNICVVNGLRMPAPFVSHWPLAETRRYAGIIELLNLRLFTYFHLFHFCAFRYARDDLWIATLVLFKQTWKHHNASDNVGSSSVAVVWVGLGLGLGLGVGVAR